MSPTPPESDSASELELDESAPVPRPRRRWKTWLKWGLISGAILFGITLVGGLLAYRHYVLQNPGAHLERTYIEQVISQESPVYYRDGKTKVGVFFAKEHRMHVPYERIPQDWINAITSAEDQRFFDHPGVDFRGIARAMWSNIRSGRVVAGGSTLTQQTAKNLYYRPDRSFRSKLQELVNALRLEAHYSKEDILEYYANQFHVSANGRGLGIGAQYFFDKKVPQLTLKECAFLAGLVKAPSRYNPFMGGSPASREKAEKRALERSHYVLRRMAREGHLSAVELREQLALPLQFKRGSFRYSSSVLLDEVERRLSESPFPELLADAGIDNPSTAGVQVTTTLDAKAQRAATYGLWHHLTEAGAWMEGLSASAFVLANGKAPRVDANHPPIAGQFRSAKVLSGTAVDLGGFECALDPASLSRAARILAQSKTGNRWAKGGTAEKSTLNSVLKPGAIVWVSVRSVGSGKVLCDLEHRPELQGAVLLTEAGKIRAMVGGNDNANFNRAVSAKRQLGSTWKTLIYQSALQLGWTPVDLLDNRRAVFPFEGTWYYPTPDHVSEPFVSMAWAGVRSENLASIWLLLHLMDRLDREQLVAMAHQTGLARGETEPRKAFIERIRDEKGVIATRKRMRSVTFGEAKRNVMDALEYAPIAGPQLAREMVELMSVYDGWGFAGQREKVGASSGKKWALEADFRILLEKAEVCESEMMALRGWLRKQKRTGFLSSFGLGEDVELLTGEEFPHLFGRLNEGVLALSCHRAAPLHVPIQEVLPPTRAALAEIRLLVNPRVADRLHLSTIRELEAEVRVLWAVRSHEEPYATENLIFHPDYRALMVMRYVTQLAQAYGIQSELPQVLSMPLGALDISLEEAVSLYRGLSTGTEMRFPGTRYLAGEVAGLLESQEVVAQGHPAHLIEEIRDRHGNILYRARQEEEQIADPRIARLTLDILTNVVAHGTGRRALRALPKVPLAGKTGTTNGFRNAAFLGFVPARDGLYTLGVYVGYDDNRSMRRGNTILHGASGALPAWIGTVQGLQGVGLLGDLALWEDHQTDAAFSYVRVGLASGLPDPSGEGLVLVEGSDGSPRRYLAALGTERTRLEGAENWLWP
jgi:membrane peptidoglycan carboxypeptidase